ncbi:MAG TPA: hypothetical protein VEK56_15945 [Vicinamibacterales bacterium]|nr:hypothetical protein [Vicinamibacterales bacterium]
MANRIEVDIWVRGTQHATTHAITSVPLDAETWTDDDVNRLLSEMLLALDREKNPGGESPAVTLRGFSWIVSPYDTGGVVIHIEMQMGTASAGPFQIDEDRLTAVIRRVIEQPTSRVQ